ncbi:TPA: hypothetical protein SIA31_000472 [Aeromonas sobria]|nr:hypothetical protein [Aeromonas sobria]
MRKKVFFAALAYILSPSVHAYESTSLACRVLEQSPRFHNSKPLGAIVSGTLNKYSSDNFSLNIDGFLVNSDYGGVAKKNENIVYIQEGGPTSAIASYDMKTNVAEMSMNMSDYSFHAKWSCEKLETKTINLN